MNHHRGSFRKLTNEEMQDKIKKGLCFRCEEKFGPNHVCRNKKFHMLLVTKEEVDDEDGSLKGKEKMEEGNEGTKTLRLSMFTLAGLTTKKSWKVWGHIGDEKVIFMLDCGASHNFLAQELIGRCGLKSVATPTYVVEIGDGRRLRCQGKCTDFVLEVQGLKTRQEFFIFDNGGADVLGLEWLASLGEVTADFGKLGLPIRGDNQ